MSTLRLSVWSGPRNVSTALMYAFAQRADTRVVDEPLYAHYLARTGVDHPGREEVLAAQDSDGERVVRDVILGDHDRPVVMFKQMAHHADGLDWGFLAECVNVLLVREPEAMLTSLVHNLETPTLADTGLEVQTRLFRAFRDAGQDPPVLDAELLLCDPAGVLERLCERLGLAWDPGMLSWPAGPRLEDGVWAPHWYANVHRSTGFQPWRPKDERVPAGLEGVLEACREHYRPLRAAAEAFLAGPGA